jgi:histidine triad (HIT) family protein
MEDSVFTKIIRGEIPCHKLYEDDTVLAFLTIQPLNPGHTLLIPKKQIEFVWDLEDGDYQAVMAASKKVALRIKEILKPKYVGEMIVGTDVPHAHVHIVPFSHPSELRQLPPPADECDHIALAALAKKLMF